MRKFVCSICGFVYDEADGIPSAGIAAGTKWEDLPSDWVCPLCGAAKADFREQPPAPQAEKPQAEKPQEAQSQPQVAEPELLRELSAGELSALCSNLAKGCEKQYLPEESGLFTRLAEYFASKTPSVQSPDTAALLALVQQDLSTAFPAANAQASTAADRGALRALVWSEKVSRMLDSLLRRYRSEGDELLCRTHVYVCETCGFVYIGDAPPDICPVCKVPSRKIAQIERRNELCMQ